MLDPVAARRNDLRQLVAGAQHDPSRLDFDTVPREERDSARVGVQIGNLVWRMEPRTEMNGAGQESRRQRHGIGFRIAMTQNRRRAIDLEVMPKCFALQQLARHSDALSRAHLTAQAGGVQQIPREIQRRTRVQLR